MSAARPCRQCKGTGSWPFPTRRVCPRCHADPDFEEQDGDTLVFCANCCVETPMDDAEPIFFGKDTGFLCSDCNPEIP